MPRGGDGLCQLGLDGLDAAFELEQPLGQVTDDGSLCFGQKIEVPEGYVIEGIEDLARFQKRGFVCEPVFALLIEEVG